MQSLLCVRQYVKDGNEKEKALAAKIDELWHGMEFDWYRNGDQNVLYWHWSPNYGWEMNFPLEGYNECLITYILQPHPLHIPFRQPVTMKGGRVAVASKALPNLTVTRSN